MLRRLALLALLALPAYGQWTPETVYGTRSFDNFNDAINFIVSLPYEQRDTVRLFQLQAPTGFFHVVCQGCDLTSVRKPPRTYTWWSPADAGAEFRKACEKRWSFGLPCWYSEDRGETVLVYFDDAPVKPKPY